jgi:hypothetical protein
MAPEMAVLPRYNWGSSLTAVTGMVNDAGIPTVPSLSVKVTVI